MRAALLPPQSLAWLVLHEVRLGLRGAAGRMRTTSRWIGLALLVAYLGFGCFLAWELRDEQLYYVPLAGDVILAITVGLTSFMVTQAILASQQALYGNGDLDLLLTAPMPERTVLSAKLFGIAATITLTYALLLLPMIVPIAVLGHPALFGMVALLAAMALVAACAGLALTLLIARIAGPRAARTVGQIAAALVGGAAFLISQVVAHRDRLGGRGALFEAIANSKIGEQGIGALPGRAAFGDPLSLTLLLGTALIIFVVTGRLFQRSFLASWQAASMRLTRPHPAAKGLPHQFRAGLFASVFAKEMRLLQRDPALVFQIFLRIIYLAPLALVGMGGRHPIPIEPGLAFASVLVVAQLAASFAWITISAEDTPDLILVAPVEKEQVDTAKLLAALTLVGPLGIILPGVIAFKTVPGAIVTLFLTVIAGALAGLIELKLGKPMPRAAFNRRRGGGAVSAILSGLVALGMGAIAGIAVYAIG